MTVFTTCPCGGGCACHGGNGAYPTPCDVPGGCGSLTRAACVAPGCTRQPSGGLLCGLHRDQLGQAIADLAADLGHAPEPVVTRGMRVGGHGGTLASERSPVDLRALSTQAQAPAVLAAWADWVRDQRSLTRPMVAYWSRRVAAPAGPACPAPCNHGSCNAIMWWHELPARRDPEADRKLLATHLDWLCGQPDVVGFWCQIRALRHQLRGRRPVRRCPCGGSVWSDPGGGWCAWCAQAWAGRELLELPRPEVAA